MRQTGLGTARTEISAELDKHFTAYTMLVKTKYFCRITGLWNLWAKVC